jgi:hypothetical protein
MCQNTNPDDFDRVQAKEYALTCIPRLSFKIELHFGLVEKAQHPKIARELQRQLREILQDGRLTMLIGDDYFEPLSVDVMPDGINADERVLPGVVTD